MPYLTPVESGEPSLVRRFSIPSELLPIVYDALSGLAYRGAWEQQGMTINDTLVLVEAMLASYENSGDADLIGTLVHYITANPPFGVLPCDGSTYDVADYPALADRLDPIYINGDGTFTLPNLSARTLVGAGAGAGGLSTYALGDVFGVENVTLTEAQLPAHTHSEQDPGIVQVQEGLGAFPQSDPGLPSTTGSTGNDEAHENRQPSYAAHIGVVAR